MGICDGERSGTVALGQGKSTGLRWGSSSDLGGGHIPFLGFSVLTLQTGMTGFKFAF